MANVEVKTFIDDITYNIKAIEAQRKRAGEYGADQESLDAMEWQIAQLKAIRLYAKMEIGKKVRQEAFD